MGSTLHGLSGKNAWQASTASLTGGGGGGGGGQPNSREWHGNPSGLGAILHSNPKTDSPCSESTLTKQTGPTSLCWLNAHREKSMTIGAANHPACEAEAFLIHQCTGALVEAAVPVDFVSRRCISVSCRQRCISCLQLAYLH